MALRWYVAHTRPMAEYAARDRLETAGLEVFLPCAQTRGNRPGHQDTPLFPGYLFLRHDLEGRGWGLIRRAPQLIGLVTFGGVAPSVPDEVITGLSQRMDAAKGSGGLWTRFRLGETVRVALGPTESLAEVVEEARSPQARVGVLLEFLGRQVEVKVPWKNVQPVGYQGLIETWSERPPRRTRGKGRWLTGYGPRISEDSPAM